MVMVMTSFEIMSKGMLASLTVAGIMAVLTIAMTKIFTEKKESAH